MYNIYNHFYIYLKFFIYVQKDSFLSSFLGGVTRNLFSLETKDGLTSQGNACSRGNIRYKCDKLPLVRTFFFKYWPLANYYFYWSSATGRLTGLKEKLRSPDRCEQVDRVVTDKRAQWHLFKKPHLWISQAQFLQTGNQPTACNDFKEITVEPWYNGEKPGKCVCYNRGSSYQDFVPYIFL